MTEGSRRVLSSKVVWASRAAQWLTALAALPEDGLGFDAHTAAHTISSSSSRRSEALFSFPAYGKHIEHRHTSAKAPIDRKLKASLAGYRAGPPQWGQKEKKGGGRKKRSKGLWEKNKGGSWVCTLHL